MAQSKAHIAATGRYEKKAYDKLLIRVRKDSDMNADAIREYVKSRGESLQGFILRAIRETMARDKAGE